ncbi:MAG: type IV pilus secretin PilQ [Vicinamibacteria bacterium]
MRAKLARVLLAVALVAAAGAPALAQDGSAAITDIRQEASERSTRLVVEMNSALAYTYYSPDPLTLVVDVPGVDASAVPARINVGSREVESLRVTQMARGDGRSLARIEVRLASLVPYQIYSRDKSLHLVFERGDRAAAAVPAAASAAEAPVAAPLEPTPPVAEAPAEPPAAAPAVAPEPEPKRRAAGPRATRILGVTPSTDAGQFELTIRADGSLQYQDFFLGNPDRLVIDMRDVSARAPYRAEVQSEQVRSVRLAQFSAGTPKIARLVLDLAERKPYRIVEANDGLKVVFGEGRTPAPAPLAALKPEPQPEPETAPLADASLPAPAPRTIAPVPAVVVPQAPAAAAAPETGGEEVKRWTGHPITFDFKDGDLQDIFRLFADISGLNVVVNPGISGKVTLKLTEVPWDQALDLILKINSLGYSIEDNVLRIARVSDLQREESDRRKLAEEKALAGELTDWTRRVYYAKAADLSDTIKRAGALSARGQLNVDPRTNTLLMRDLPQYVEKAKALIGELDIATPQVEIEARIVVTSRNFTRDLGIQWGFNQVQSPRYGNTTNQIFPNSIVLNGQGVPAVGGLSPTQIQGVEAIGTTGRGYAVNMPASGFNSAIGVSMGNILGNFNLDAALTALERQGRGRLLSTPKVTTQNNMAAEIKQGIQIPIQTVANNTVTVTFKDAVLTLKVTPQISEAGTVVLSVEVENNNPDFANLVNGIPPINTQSAKTNVLVRDGSTAVIGGIYQSQEQSRQDSTPFLGKIPILGYLFKNKFVTSSNNELLLFITPRIIKS